MFTVAVIWNANKTGLAEPQFSLAAAASALGDDSYRAAHGAAPGPTCVDAVATLKALNEKPSLTELCLPRKQKGIWGVFVADKGHLILFFFVCLLACFFPPI